MVLPLASSCHAFNIPFFMRILYTPIFINLSLQLGYLHNHPCFWCVISHQPWQGWEDLEATVGTCSAWGWATCHTSPLHQTISYTFSILLIVFTAFQGFFIFIMHCVRMSRAAKLWKVWFFKVKEMRLANSYPQLSAELLRASQNPLGLAN